MSDSGKEAPPKKRPAAEKAEGAEGANKRRPKTKYGPGSPDSLRGVPGLLVTCHPGKERHCAREILSLLEDLKPTSAAEGTPREAEDKPKSISERLSAELADLRDQGRGETFPCRHHDQSDLCVMHKHKVH